mgnify:CR=1 FL=1
MYCMHLPAEARRHSQRTEAILEKSPAGLVDLKAGVRFLKANDKVMAGDVNKIIPLEPAQEEQ